MKFTIDRPIRNSYSEEIILEQTWDFSFIEDETKREKHKKKWIELNDEVMEGWIDDDGVCHRTMKTTIECIDVETLEELCAITKEYGKIVFGTNIEDFDGWIEVYDDYRE